mmetsp:Transcript_10552/g.21701  ORF Transcript_10552/g.21701 Transcript_10552/m.21701 type:complete len:316 (-) Transcript_10552:4796-5743(-)
MTEITPLLRDRPQAPSRSALAPQIHGDSFSRGVRSSRYATSHQPGARPIPHKHAPSLSHNQQALLGMQRRSQVHSLQYSSRYTWPTTTSLSSFNNYLSSSRTIQSSSTSHFSGNSNNVNRQNNDQSTSKTPNLSRLLVSLPYHLLCIASPYLPPCCGLCCCLTCIRTSEYGVLERFGKFERILEPGMHRLIWPMEREAGRISVRVRQIDLRCETKSRDHGTLYRFFIFVLFLLFVCYFSVVHYVICLFVAVILAQLLSRSVLTFTFIKLCLVKICMILFISFLYSTYVHLFHEKNTPGRITHLTNLYSLVASKQR